MKARSFTVLVVAVLLVAALPCVSLAADGAAVFKSRCSPCHGADGSGNTPMGKKVGAKALGSPEVQKLADAELQKTVASGKNKMPEFGSKLSAQQISELVKVIRGFAAK
jgi:mono/diheme cytochrome c family protein